ncbi:MAG: M48 family metallopeptidase [Chloroflexota bacterium]|nr:MAG: M48 family metallopeptidase [Chloroflexota bacterium]
MQPIEPRLDTKRQELAKEYARLTRRLSFIDLAIVSILFVELIFGGVSVKISSFLTFSQPWASALYFTILVICLGIIVMPLTYYQGFILPRRYGLSSQKFGAWLADRAKASALGFLLGLVMVILLYWLLDRFPDIWWLCAGISVVLLSLLLTRLTPNLLLPIFFKLEPLANVDLKQRLMNLAKRAQTQIVGVFTMDLSSKGTTANAMLAGLGKTRSIILSDTLLQQYTAEEIEVILAHELGHHIHRDIPKLIAVQAVAVLLAFYLSDLVLRTSLLPLGFQGIADVAAFPLLVLSLAVFGLIVTPFINAYSRYIETSADKAALELTGNPQAFVTAMTKLTDQNLNVADPSRWAELLFYDHPPYNKRVDLAQRYNMKVS